MADEGASVTQDKAEAQDMNRQQQRTAASRDALLEGARRVLREHGYNQASVRLITRAAHRSHGTFYIHFENKEAIYATLLEEMRHRLHQESRAAWRADDPLASVQRSIEIYVCSFQRDREFWELLDGSSATSALFQRERIALRRALVSDIRKGIDKSHTARLDDMDPDLVAEILAAMLEQTCATFLLNGGTVEPDTITTHVGTLWGRMLGYVHPGDAPPTGTKT